tara:strand:- start:185 stop:517 length:333 start_codon:yes stop_codon:yes gene_type:complete
MEKKFMHIFKKCLVISLISIFFFNNAESNDDFAEGRKIFMEKGNCAMCHALSDAGSKGNIGPNLNDVKPSELRVVGAVTNGIGVMPAYEGILNESEIKAVAKYVSEAANK